ncbi:hypothetical protein SMY30_004097 [Cronobacter sakazakii]|nr:hypothetical protein [Cronobacter sakazakii]ELY3999461.1 hypothetical protein [Cronobacter sakazakii]ELY4070379.1 hypothetical protein [Cronobacter sakazakii]ELY4847845.1 hypothetical protein [Cronobacter sakazakii]
MKLIDLLVQELPKRGGWPDGEEYAWQDHNREVRFSSNTTNNDFFPESGVLCYDYRRMGQGNPEKQSELSVTRTQYEAAIAAAQQQVWDGKGLPPVGCRIEAFSGGEWVEAIVTYNEPPECHGDAAAWKEVLAFDCRTTRPFWTDEFRPIRSEADNKRAAGVTALAKAGGAVDFEYGRKTIDGELSAPGWYELYDKIAAGEVAGIRIE